MASAKVESQEIIANGSVENENTDQVNGLVENENTEEVNGLVENEKTGEVNGLVENENTREVNGLAESEKTGEVNDSEEHKKTEANGLADDEKTENEKTEKDFLKDSLSVKVMKKLCNRGVVSREFLKRYKARLACMKGFVHSDPLSERRHDNEEYWQVIREMFAYDENDANDAVPMNTANFAPTFDEVQLQMNDYHLELNKNISIQNRVEELSLIIEAAQQLIAQQLGVSVKEIALMRNGTEANNNVNNGQLLKPTDEVVIWEQNHGTNGQAWYFRQSQAYFVINCIPSDLNGATNDEEIVNEFVKLVTSNTKFVAFSHLSNVGGRLMPAEHICRAIHSQFPDCHVHVDGAMTWGCMNLNLAQMDCDSYSASAHKWFCGPKETGILYMKLSKIPNFIPNTFGYNAKINLPSELPKDASRFQLLGQRADPSLMCLLETAEIMGDIGFQVIQDRVLFLGSIVYAGFQSFGENFPMTTPSEKSQRLGVIVAGVDPTWGRNLYNYLYETHRVAVAPTSGIRVSAHIFNTLDQLTALLEAVAEYIEISPPPSPPAKVQYSKW